MRRASAFDTAGSIVIKQKEALGIVKSHEAEVQHHKEYYFVFRKTCRMLMQLSAECCLRSSCGSGEQATHMQKTVVEYQANLWRTLDQENAVGAYICRVRQKSSRVGLLAD